MPTNLLDWLRRYWRQDARRTKYLCWCWLRGERVCWPWVYGGGGSGRR